MHGVQMPKWLRITSYVIAGAVGIAGAMLGYSKNLTLLAVLAVTLPIEGLTTSPSGGTNPLGKNTTCDERRAAFHPLRTGELTCMSEQWASRHSSRMMKSFGPRTTRSMSDSLLAVCKFLAGDACSSLLA